MLGAHLLGKDGRENVEFVTHRASKEAIGFICLRILKDATFQTVADDAFDIAHVHDLFDGLVVFVHDGDVVLFLQKAGGEGFANLADTNDNDFHTIHITTFTQDCQIEGRAFPQVGIIYK